MQNSCQFILVRHGETKFNRDGVFRGRVDIPLNDVGRHQADSTGKALAGYRISAVYSSPLKRAVETAEAVARYQEHTPHISIDEAFNNIDLGYWQGQPKTEIQSRFPELWSLWVNTPERMRLPGGETLNEIRDRAFPEMVKLCERHYGETIALVSHRSVLKVLIAAAVGLTDDYFWRFHLDNSSYSVLIYARERGFCLTKLNITHHIDEMVQEWV